VSPKWIAYARDRWTAASVGIAAGLAIAGAVVGFAWLPFEQPGQQFRGVWDAICSASGLIQVPLTHQQAVQPRYPVTQVEVTPQMLRGASAEAIGRGATLALRCTMCHGARGLSQAETPNLAGQYPSAIYKELLDFKTGARVSAVMTPLVADLSDSDMRELAAYYAYLPRVYGDPATEGEPPRIVADGAPMRNIAPCGACHGELASKPGAPWLRGQPVVYLHTQLQAFASGARRNDISEQMRNVARGMTTQEIDAASRFYSGLP
jgi:cytochrome c553